MAPPPVIEPMIAPESPPSGQIDGTDPYAGRWPQPAVMAGVLVGGQVMPRLCTRVRTRNARAT
jgi:hypothetical protein